MRIQQLPESHMLHGRVIPQGTTLRGEMPAHQKEKSDGHWFHFHFSAVSPAPLTEISTGVNHLPQQDWARQGPVGWWEKEEFFSSEVWRKKNQTNQTATTETNPKQNPKTNNQTNQDPSARAAQKVTEGPGKSGQRDTHWGQPYSFSSSARDHFMTRPQGFSCLTQVSKD